MTEWTKERVNECMNERTNESISEGMKDEYENLNEGAAADLNQGHNDLRNLIAQERRHLMLHICISDPWQHSLLDLHQYNDSCCWAGVDGCGGNDWSRCSTVDCQSLQQGLQLKFAAGADVTD